MLHLFVHQYLFLKCITEFLHGNYHWVFLWFCRLYSDGLALGVWFMTSCCCLVEFGFSCFNHASIESWFANYSVLDILHWKVNLSHLTQNDVSYGLECNTTGHFCNRAEAHCVLTSFFCLHQQINTLLVVLLPCSSSSHTLSLRRTVEINKNNMNPFTVCSECWVYKHTSSFKVWV